MADRCTARPWPSSACLSVLTLAYAVTFMVARLFTVSRHRLHRWSAARSTAHPTPEGGGGVLFSGVPRRVRRCRTSFEGGSALRGTVGPIGVKTCTECRAPHNTSEFYRDSTRPDGRERRCKKCSNGRRAERKRLRTSALANEGNRVVDRSQGCCVCGSMHADSHGRRLHLDASSDGEAIRGVLCTRCSSALGLLQNDLSLLESAARYVALSRRRVPVPRWADDAVPARAVAAGSA